MESLSDGFGATPLKFASRYHEFRRLVEKLSWSQVDEVVNL